MYGKLMGKLMLFFIFYLLIQKTNSPSYNPSNSL
jgi:hypothetical protein